METESLTPAQQAIRDEFLNCFLPQLNKWRNGYTDHRAATAFKVFKNLPPSARQYFKLQVIFQGTLKHLDWLKVPYARIGSCAVAYFMDEREVANGIYLVTWTRREYETGTRWEQSKP